MIVQQRSRSPKDTGFGADVLIVTHLAWEYDIRNRTYRDTERGVRHTSRYDEHIVKDIAPEMLYTYDSGGISHDDPR